MVTPVLGDIAAAAEKTGSLLSIVTAALDVALSPKESLIVAVQIRSSAGLELFSVTVKEAPMARVPPLASVQT